MANDAPGAGSQAATKNNPAHRFVRYALAR